jgi:hypothetical protein
MVLSGLAAYWFLAMDGVSECVKSRAWEWRTCVSDKSLLVVPGDVRGSDTVTLVVDENLDLSALHDTDTRVGGSQIDTDDGTRDCLVAAVLCAGIGAKEHHGRKKHQEEVEDG